MASMATSSGTKKRRALLGFPHCRWRELARKSPECTVRSSAGDKEVRILGEKVGNFRPERRTSGGPANQVNNRMTSFDVVVELFESCVSSLDESFLPFRYGVSS